MTSGCGTTYQLSELFQLTSDSLEQENDQYLNVLPAHKLTVLHLRTTVSAISFCLPLLD